MNLYLSALFALAEAKPEVSPNDVGFELGIWKLVVIIGAGAFVAILLIKRLGDIAAKKKTEMMIEQVVGKEEAAKASDWVEDDDED